MAWFLTYLLLAALSCFVVVWFIGRRRLRKTEADNSRLRDERVQLHSTYEKMFSDARRETETMRQEARDEAASIVAKAEHTSEEIAIKAAALQKQSDLYQQTVISMSNILNGYGDEYIVPRSTLIDDLAEDYSHKDAGVRLKDARKKSRAMVKSGEAAVCEYVEENRRTSAINFVIDAFNGKVDTAISDVKHNNFGKLRQAIHDAWALVNHNGQAFRNAQITPGYRDARIDELNWAAITHGIREQEREEQRLIRQQQREEARVEREIQKAIKEAEKEERMLKRAMEKARREVAEATAERRALLETELADMELRLRDAEEKNQRAVSMAQLTKRGHVYIISNVGSLGENIYKIGLTRRLEPMDRVNELGDSSVPFDFDTHAMIPSDDAPALERELHKHFILSQVNKVDHRKEFFRTTIQELRTELESMGIETRWTMAADAAEYRESLAIDNLIEQDPQARDAWLSRQLTLDPTDYADMSIGDGN